MRPIEYDSAVRGAAFAYLDVVTDHGDRPATWAQLMGFSVEGERIPLASQQGSSDPRDLTYPISVRTAPPPLSGKPPYPDEITPDGFLA